MPATKEASSAAPEGVASPSDNANVAAFTQAVADADAVVFVTPEYNYSIPGVLKNAIDWASRPAFNSVLTGKPAGVLTAAMSPVGGARAQMHLKDILSSTLTPVYTSPDYLLPLAHEAFNDKGELTDATALRRLKRYLSGLIDWVDSSS